MITVAAYDIYVENLLERMRRFHSALNDAGIPYRIIGGMAVFFHVSERDHDKARFTRDVDAAVRRDDLKAIIRASENAGFVYRHVASTDMLVDPIKPSARSAVHLVFAGEKVRASDSEPIPFSEPVRTVEGVLLAPVADLLRMKLTSFRLKDKVHIQDMDSVGLITPEMDEALPDALRERLKEVRATE